MDMIFSLITKPFSFGVMCASFVALASWRLVKAVINFHADFCWRILIWSIAFVSLPIRVLTALQRERTLEMHLLDMQTRFDNVIWENKELEGRLQRAIKERKVIEAVFEEIEEEHEKALSKIDVLQAEVQDLKEENMRLCETQGKASWDHKDQEERFGGLQKGIALPTNYKLPSWSTANKGSGIIVQDIIMQGGSLCDGEKTRSQEQSLFKPAAHCTDQMMSRDLLAEKILESQRVIALSRSLFSSILSVTVGMIIWKAEDPCMPLVAALFTVVGMSLSSVVQFFSTIRNKPASDAVALLSINWFILGTLTSPTLPRVARVLAPRVINLADRFLIRFGFSFS